MKKTAAYLNLPLVFLIFWFKEKPLELLSFFRSLNDAYLRLVSLPLFLRTFFKPLKNEYREGLVGFSRAIGMAVKTCFLLVEIPVFVLLLAFEGIVLLSFVTFPLVTVALLFW